MNGSWKTTLFGLLAATGAAVSAGIQTGIIDATTLPHSVKGVAGLVTVIGTAGIGVFARDNDKTSEQVNAGKPGETHTGALLLAALFLFGLAFVLSLAGCSSFRSEQVHTTQDGTRIESRQRITTFWDSESKLSKLRISTTEKTQGMSLGALSEESSGSNAVSLFREGISAAVEGAIKGVK